MKRRGTSGAPRAALAPTPRTRSWETQTRSTLSSSRPSPPNGSTSPWTPGSEVRVRGGEPRRRCRPRRGGETPLATHWPCPPPCRPARGHGRIPTPGRGRLSGLAARGGEVRGRSQRDDLPPTCRVRSRSIGSNGWGRLGERGLKRVMGREIGTKSPPIAAGSRRSSFRLKIPVPGVQLPPCRPFFFGSTSPPLATATSPVPPPAPLALAMSRFRVARSSIA